jgi:L-ascorbate metabolism protein UlaG (beta-lactamase superfamily)
VTKSRRRFFRYFAAGTGTAIGGAVFWVAASKQRAARWARRLIADAGRRIVPAPVRPDPDAWSDNQITICWLGHATTLINFYGIRILTDPVSSSRAGISYGLGVAGPKRYVGPALSLRELPPVDVLLLSHAHYDHMDLPSLSRFPRSTFTVTAKGTSDVLAAIRLKQVTELAWNGRASFENAKGNLQIEAVEVKHWGRRWPSNAPRGYNGYVLRREGKALLFGGDTAKTPRVPELRSRGPFELAIMPIGLTGPGFGIIARRNKRLKWRTPPGRATSCRCTIRPSS